MRNICSEIRQVEGGFIIQYTGSGEIRVSEVVCTRFQDVVEWLHRQTEERHVGDVVNVVIMRQGKEVPR